jgi:predicted RNA methylase
MSTYSTPGGHRSMVFDDQRNGYYAQAIKRAVNGDSVVLDLGAGLGLHGFIAAYAGARKVYLVEPAPVLEVARQLVSSNDLDERIECGFG